MKTSKRSKQDLKRAKIIGLHPKSVVLQKKTFSYEEEGSHVPQTYHKCSFCDYITLHRNHFWVHVKKIHQLVKCKWCKLYGQTDEIKPHEGRCRKAKKSKIVECDQCGKSFARKTVLTRHQESCLQNANLKCSKCQKMYFQKRAYNRHIKDCSTQPQEIRRKYIHRKKSVPCKVCDKLFVDTKAMSQHMFSHHNQWNHSENDNFQCDICDKTFGKESNLKGHFTVVHKVDTAQLLRKACIKSEYGNVEQERTSDSVCCLDCFDTFPSVKNLKNHCKQVHNKTAVSTCCNICGQHVILNQDCHGDECYDILQCLHCQKQFFKFKDFIVHSLEMHPYLPIKFIGIENGIKSKPLGLPKYIAAGSRLVRYNRYDGKSSKYPFSVTYMESKNEIMMFGKTFARICPLKVCKPDDMIKGHLAENARLENERFPCGICAKTVEQNKRIEEFLAKQESKLEGKKSKTLFITGKSIYPLF